MDLFIIVGASAGGGLLLILLILLAVRRIRRPSKRTLREQRLRAQQLRNVPWIPHPHVLDHTICPLLKMGDGVAPKHMPSDTRYKGLEQARVNGRNFEDMIYSKISANVYLLSQVRLDYSDDHIADLIYIHNRRGIARYVLIECKHSAIPACTQQIQAGIDQLKRYRIAVEKQRNKRVLLMVLFISFPYDKDSRKSAFYCDNVLILNHSMANRFGNALKDLEAYLSSTRDVGLQ